MDLQSDTVADTVRRDREAETTWASKCAPEKAKESSSKELYLREFPLYTTRAAVEASMERMVTPFYVRVRVGSPLLSWAQTLRKMKGKPDLTEKEDDTIIVPLEEADAAMKKLLRSAVKYGFWHPHPPPEIPPPPAYVHPWNETGLELARKPKMIYIATQQGYLSDCDHTEEAQKYAAMFRFPGGKPVEMPPGWYLRRPSSPNDYAVVECPCCSK